MKWNSVNHPEFALYGRVLEGLDVTALLDTLRKTDRPERGVIYVPSFAPLEDTDVFPHLRDSVYGGMPIQIGYCNGSNTRLNCLEYHRDSEINIAADDVVLLLARQQDMEGDTLRTETVKAFHLPAGTAVELYATTLHYAPCNSGTERGFRVAVVLPQGTNMEAPVVSNIRREDRLLRARNKWLIAHAEAPEAADGAVIGLLGTNLDIT